MAVRYGAMHRLFVALRPPEAVRESLLGTMNGVSGARWQDDSQLHVTLRFIGEVERPLAEDVAVALGGLHGAAPTVALAGVGRFGDTLWAGIAPQERLAALHRKVDQALVRVGLPPERRAYLPHVTLARLSRSNAAGPDATAWLGRHAGLASPTFTLGAMILFESRLGHHGASYAAVERYPLSPGAG